MHVCRYKEFLDSVTPKEWFAAQAARQQQKRQELLAEWRAECEAVKARRDAAAAARAKAEADYSNARTQQEAEQAERAIKKTTAALKVCAGGVLWCSVLRSPVRHFYHGTSTEGTCMFGGWCGAVWCACPCTAILTTTALHVCACFVEPCTSPLFSYPCY